MLNIIAYFMLTAPMILKKDLISAFAKLKRNKDANGIISVSKYGSNPMRLSLYKQQIFKI